MVCPTFNPAFNRLALLSNSDRFRRGRGRGFNCAERRAGQFYRICRGSGIRARVALPAGEFGGYRGAAGAGEGTIPAESF